MTEWLKIRNDYIYSTERQNYKTLAKKYNISVYSIEKRASAEQWKKTRKEIQNDFTKKLQEKTTEKTANTISLQRAITHQEVFNTTHEILQRCTEALQQLTMTYSIHDNTVTTYDTTLIDVDKLRKLVTVIKDLNEILPDDTDNETLRKLDEVLRQFGGNI